MNRDYINSDGIKIHYIDFGGEGQSVLLLHGLMGNAATWSNTAKFLVKNYRVIAIDQRGHGNSDKPFNNYSRDDYVNDAIKVIEELNLQKVILIGHSMGGLNSWVLAARRPDLVSALIIEDMTAATNIHKENDKWKKWFDSWPVPFTSIKEIREYFSKQHPSYADFFMETFKAESDGYYPMFNYNDMLKTREEFENNHYWNELELVECPSLVVKGENSDCLREELVEMSNRLKHGEFIEIPQAGHIVHFDQPIAWQVAVESFLNKIHSHQLIKQDLSTPSIKGRFLI